MSHITADVDSGYPDYDWYDSELEYWQEQLRAQGINISDEVHKGHSGKEYRQPAVSFSGFYSQGDGLAFDCSVSWSEFFAVNPSFAEQLPEWFLLLSANPDIVEVSSTRNSRGNTMRIDVDYRLEQEAADGCVANGFFAGVPTDELPLVFRDLEEWMDQYLDHVASDMYQSLQDLYESECEYIKEQGCEDIREQYATEIQAALSILPSVFASRTAAVTALYESGLEIDFEDLETLGYIVFWCGRWMKREEVCYG